MPSPSAVHWTGASGAGLSVKWMRYLSEGYSAWTEFSDSRNTSIWSPGLCWSSAPAMAGAGSLRRLHCMNRWSHVVAGVSFPI